MKQQKIIKGLYVWRWGINFNEGWLAYPRIHFTIFFNGMGLWLYTALGRKELVVRK